MINSSAILGLAIGSMTAGKAIALGRRRAGIIAEVAVIVASLITMVQTLQTICFGRFILGLAAGVLNIVMGKSLDETVPSQYSTLFGCMTNAFICTSVWLAMIMGLILPKEEEDFVADNKWRIVFGMPIVFAMI